MKDSTCFPMNTAKNLDKTVGPIKLPKYCHQCQCQC